MNHNKQEEGIVFLVQCVLAGMWRGRGEVVGREGLRGRYRERYTDLGGGVRVVRREGVNELMSE